jgi:aspartate/methionine/tyrosine aminotransferase
LANSIAIESIDAAYGAVRVLERVSMTIDAGETVVLLGTNGNGKSTLMKTVMGIVRPSAGSIEVDIDGERHNLIGRSTEDIVDLGFGNPDLPSPPVAVDKLCEAVRNPRNHRYSSSRGIPKLRLAITDLYRRRFDVDLDPETQACTTIGAKEGFSHLMWVLLGPGDAALVPSPSYPIHIWGPILAGAAIHCVRLGPEQDFFANLHAAWEQAWPRPRVVVASFPHNPTTMCVDLDFMARLVEFVQLQLAFPHVQPLGHVIPQSHDS